MHIRTFRAESLQDALETIRQQMGPDASVLHTRQVRDGWMGWLGRTYVEVTAGLKDNGDRVLAGSEEIDVRPIGRNSPDQSLGFSAPASHDSRPPTPDSLSPPSDPSLLQNRLVRNSQASQRHIPALQDYDQQSSVSATTESELPAGLQAYAAELRLMGVHPETAARWVGATISFASSLGELSSEAAMASAPWLEHLQRSVGRELTIGSPIQTPPGDRRIVALVGPTGVGKTTTVAKLAAGFRLQAKRRVGLLTIDTFRIAAVQQLRAYADIMDLPMEVVERPDQMRPALGRLGDVDLVLIDTAGRSPRSDARIEQLVEMLRSAQPDETHLVLSGTSSATSAATTISGFAPVRPTSAILTKIDEAPQIAPVLSALASADGRPGLPISYTTDGQQVPDDISMAERSYLLGRLLSASFTLPSVSAA